MLSSSKEPRSQRDAHRAPTSQLHPQPLLLGLGIPTGSVKGTGCEWGGCLAMTLNLLSCPLRTYCSFVQLKVTSMTATTDECPLDVRCIVHLIRTASLQNVIIAPVAWWSTETELKWWSHFPKWWSGEVNSWEPEHEVLLFPRHPQFRFLYW